MKKLLLIALLIVGCVFGDTIVFEQMGKTHTFDIKFIKAGNGMVFFEYYREDKSRNCNIIIKFTDDYGNPINYDCNAVIEMDILPKSTISPNDYL